MPYITKYRKEELTHKETHIDSAGELNYLLSQVVLRYIKTHGKKYSVYNDVVGALENLKLEVYRRLVAIHEDKKILENGDVFDD